MRLKIKQRLQRLQAGISLLEVLLSLSIIAIILVMATRYYFEASATAKTSQTVTLLEGLKSKAYQIEQIKGAVALTDLTSSKYYEDFMNAGRTAYALPLGGTINITGSAGSYQLVATFGNEEDCVRVSNAIRSASCSGSTLDLSINQA